MVGGSAGRILAVGILGSDQSFELRGGILRDMRRLKKKPLVIFLLNDCNSFVDFGKQGNLHPFHHFRIGLVVLGIAGFLAVMLGVVLFAELSYLNFNGKNLGIFPLCKSSA